MIHSRLLLRRILTGGAGAFACVSLAYAHTVPVSSRLPSPVTKLKKASADAPAAASK